MPKGQVELPNKTWDEVLAFQEQEDIPSLSETLRRLVRAGLKVYAEQSRMGN